MNTVNKKLAQLTGIVAAAFLALNAQAEDAAKAPDNGTDPSRYSTAVSMQWEHLDLNNDVNYDVLNFTYWQPFGEKQNYNLRVRAPLVSNNALGNSDYDMGDFSLKLNNVFSISKTYALILAGEAIFDTASRPELGTGKNVFEGTLIYARFLQSGAIFAPTWVQTNSVSGDSSRADINTTTFDFYYVPKMSNPKYFMTYDPALVFDHENDQQFGSLAITFGRSIGPAFGGNSQVFIKPTVFAGDDKPGTWGVELGYKVIGF